MQFISHEFEHHEEVYVTHVINGCANQQQSMQYTQNSNKLHCNSIFVYCQGMKINNVSLLKTTLNNTIFQRNTIPLITSPTSAPE